MRLDDGCRGLVSRVMFHSPRLYRSASLAEELHVKELYHHVKVTTVLSSQSVRRRQHGVLISLGLLRRGEKDAVRLLDLE